jgi:triosephosphate isomerase
MKPLRRKRSWTEKADWEIEGDASEDDDDADDGNNQKWQKSETCSKRKLFVGANWKGCVEDCSKVDKFAEDLKKELATAGSTMSDIELCLCPPYVFLDRLRCQLDGNVIIGSQNVGEALATGKSTGTITTGMLKSLGCKWVLLGHSDRRNSLGETDALIAEKVAQCLGDELCVNLTVGETLAKREAGLAIETLIGQLSAAAAQIPVDAWNRVVIAYEPVWAIGEGATPCTPEETQRVLSELRAWVRKNASDDAAQACRFLYTGSVNEKNASHYAGLSEVDGFVVGRAGLDTKALIGICQTLAQCKSKEMPQTDGEVEMPKAG